MSTLIDYSNKITINKSMITRIHFLVIGFAFHKILNNEGNLIISELMIYESILIKSSYITIYVKCIFMLLAIQN